MPGFETFEIELQNNLNNLYNPAYKSASIIFEGMDLDPSLGWDFVRGKIIQSISDMGSPSFSPPGSKSSHIFELLNYRFVQSLSQEKAAEMLDISTRHFRRKQREAIHALAVRLWEKHLNSVEGQPEPAPEPDPTPSNIDAIVREIQVLTHSSPGITVHLENVLKKAIEMAQYLQKDQSIQVSIQPIPTDLELPIHPTVLRQIVLYIILCVLQSGCSGCLEINAEANGEILSVSFSVNDPTVAELIHVPDLMELLPALGGKAEIETGKDGWQLSLLFSRISRLNVLVIDDNLDQIYLYRKMLALTNYELTHLFSGEDLLLHITDFKPDLILMDILLPGIDGWDLLLQIRQNPATAKIPVIVSSVMGNETMAKSLGANGYLPKSADRKSFLQMLDQAARTSKAVNPPQAG